jgi:S-methylmethionine-dependent homocysteine/selenocysteine methylase
VTNPATALADGGRLLLDGGLGQELVRRGVDTSHGLWSAQALLDSPETVTAAHRDFVDAGADVITTNTYATTQRRFPDRARWRTLNETAARLARDAASAAGRSVYIAGSLPPLNGSYRPDRVGDPAELEREYREQAGVLAAHVDLLLCETMSTAGEAAAAARGAVAAGLPVWVSWTLLDDGSGNLRSGETIAAAVDAIGDLPVQAFLVNCSIPESVGAAVAELRTLANRPYGAYANAFEPIAVGVDDGRDLPNARSDLDPPTYAARVNDWLAAGARIVGGCCEVGPAHIAELKRRFFAGTAEPAE